MFISSHFALNTSLAKSQTGYWHRTSLTNKKGTIDGSFFIGNIFYRAQLMFFGRPLPTLDIALFTTRHGKLGLINIPGNN